jgi:hypothetical protein
VMLDVLSCGCGSQMHLCVVLCLSNFAFFFSLDVKVLYICIMLLYFGWISFGTKIMFCKVLLETESSNWADVRKVLVNSSKPVCACMSKRTRLRK